MDKTVDLSTTPALNRLLTGRDLVNPGDAYGECCGCSFAMVDAEAEFPPNSADPGEGYYNCSLLDQKHIWGENPKCSIEDWQRRAREEVTALYDGRELEYRRLCGAIGYRADEADGQSPVQYALAMLAEYSEDNWRDRTRIRELEGILRRMSDYLETATNIIAEDDEVDEGDIADARGLMAEVRAVLESVPSGGAD